MAPSDIDLCSHQIEARVGQAEILVHSWNCCLEMFGIVLHSWLIPRVASTHLLNFIKTSFKKVYEAAY